MKVAGIAQDPGKANLRIFGQVLKRRGALNGLDPDLDDGKRVLNITLTVSTFSTTRVG